MSRGTRQSTLPSSRTERRTQIADGALPRRQSDDEVTIWWSNLSETQANFGLQANLLSDEDLLRAGRMSNSNVRDRWITGRATLRSILSVYLGIPERAISIAYEALGKPQVKNRGTFRFNLSHSADLAALAVTWKKRVGIDILRIRDNININDLAPWTFAENDLNAWRRLPEDEQRLSFLRSWVRKEAYLKGQGFGLTHSMRDLQVIESSTGCCMQIVNTRSGAPDRRWRIHDLTSPEPGFVAAVAVDGKVSSLISRRWPDGSICATWTEK